MSDSAKAQDLTTLKEIPDTDFFKNYLKLFTYPTSGQGRAISVLETFVDKIEGSSRASS